MSRLSRISAVIIILIALALPAFALSAPSEDEFIRKASIGNTFEIESSRLALSRPVGEATKTFAQMMVDDHGKAGQELTQVLQPMNKAPVEGLDEEHQKALDDLETASNEDFEAEYIQVQTKAHDDAVALFTEYAKNGDNAPLRRFANKTLPTLEHHRDQIYRLTNRSQ